MILGDARFAFLCCSYTRDNDSKRLSDLGMTISSVALRKARYAGVVRSHSFAGKACASTGRINAAAKPGSVNALQVLGQLDQSAGVAVPQASRCRLYKLRHQLF
jgi:hypothetical protein